MYIFTQEPPIYSKTQNIIIYIKNNFRKNICYHIK